METIYYKIADIVIAIQSDLNFPFDLDKYTEYKCDPQNIDFIVRIQKTNNIAKIQNQMVRMVNRTLWGHQYIDANDRTWTFFLCDQFYYAVLFVDEKEAVLYHLGDKAILELINKHGCNPLSFIGLEKILIQYSIIILHSCHVHYKGKSILFSAPSGTGKSTQGDLWERFLGATVINGDRTAVCKKNNNWISYGLPMCGTSQIHKNMSSEIAAIVILEQCEENKVQKLSPFIAFQKIYGETTSYYWNRQFVNKVMDIVEEIINEIPIFLYQCTKETEAALFLENYLKQEGIIYE